MRPEVAPGTAGPGTAAPDAGVSGADARVPDGEAVAAGEVVAETAPIEAVDVAVCRVPTDAPFESDGTLTWDGTTVVLVEVSAGGVTGLGWTYAGAASGQAVVSTLRPVLVGADGLATRARWQDMAAALRNEGLPGAGAMALSACDVALWDLRARALGVAIVDLLGPGRDLVPIYGSGGFCSYDDDRLADQLAGWVEAGIPRVKLKVGREPADDPRRVALARRAVGDEAELFVDANGAHRPREAVALGRRYADSGVSWYEEPVSSDDVAGLAQVRRQLGGAMDVAAGEYGWSPWGLGALVASGAVDVVQPDVTRCGGFTGFAAVAATCDALQVPLSAHCAPQLSAIAGAAAPRLLHVEWFHDHVRVDRLLLDDPIAPLDGSLAPRREVVGHGLALDPEAVEAHLVWSDTT